MRSWHHTPGVISLIIMLLLSTAIARADTIFFASGVEHFRNLELNYAGSDESPLVITSTGQEKAIISAGNGFGLHLNSCHNIIVRNILFKGAGRLTGNKADGIVIEDCHDIVIEEVEVLGFQHSGLLVTGTSSHINLTSVLAHDNGFAGIHVFGPYPDKYKCRNITIERCIAENNPGDPTVLDNHSGNGILIGACDSVIIDHCKATGNGWDMPRTGNGPVGIWAWHADHVVIQHCIAYKNRTSPGAHDGGGFDLDGGVTNSMIQYCLSYENEGAGFGLFEYTGAHPWHHNTIRYNISINDGIKNGQAAVVVWNGNPAKELLTNAYVYNNVFYNDRNQGRAIWHIDDHHEDFFYANNIFLTNGPALAGSTSNSDYFNNVYWNPGSSFALEGYTSFIDWANATGNELLGDSVVGMNLDPMLTDPGPVSITDPGDMNQETLGGFRLQPGSPVIDKGLDLETLFGIVPGNTDMFGNRIPSGNGFEPGVHEIDPVLAIYGDNLPGADWIMVCPNPVGKEEIRIRLLNFPESDELKITIWDLQGRNVAISTFPNPREEIILPTTGTLKAGNLYLLKAESGNSSQTTRILVD